MSRPRPPLARYDTPLGEAGFDVVDVCNRDRCNTAIDRGMSYLCGIQPGVAGKDSCGRWFCPEHIHPELGSDGAQRCVDCWAGAQ